jgi:hypothetical protein
MPLYKGLLNIFRLFKTFEDAVLSGGRSILSSEIRATFWVKPFYKYMRQFQHRGLLEGKEKHSF